MLVNIALVPVVNWLTTLIGTRQVYLWAIAIWIATSLPCGLADTARGVIFYRLLQGIGESLHIPTVITVMYQAFPPHQRGLAMGLSREHSGSLRRWAGPWAAIFYSCMAGGCCFLSSPHRPDQHRASPVGIPKMRDATHHALDWWGLATLTPALTLLLFALSQSQRPGWSRQALLLLITAGLIGLVVFALMERGQKAPIIDFGLFRERALSAACSVYFLNTFTGMERILPSSSICNMRSATVRCKSGSCSFQRR